ncbi:MAG: hypothetical protein WCR08_04340 [Gammaproteobacteria bacterium]
MPIILFTSGAQKAIHILTDRELATFHTLYSDQGSIKNIRDCLSLDLAGLPVYAELVRLETTWPLANQLFSEALIQQMAPVVAFEQRNGLHRDAQEGGIETGNHCPRTFIQVCQDREFIAMFLHKGKKQELKDYVKKPNTIYHLNIPSVPVCHVPMATFDLAVSECLTEHVDINWLPTAEGDYLRVIEQHANEALTWLQTAEDLYQRLVLPHLNMVQTLHTRHLNHGDITDDNVVMSEKFGKVFFIDFTTLGNTRYIDEADIARNELGYYLWHTERLYDLANVSYAIDNLANKYLPNIAKTDDIIQYFAQLGRDLDAIVEQHIAFECNHVLELDTECILRLKHHTIATISSDIQQLYAARMAALISSSYVAESKEEPELARRPEKLVRVFSMYKEGKGDDMDEITSDKSTMNNIEFNT